MGRDYLIYKSLILVGDFGKMMAWERGGQIMNEETPIKMDAQLALGRAENIKEWINRFAETANRDDYQKLMEKYADLGSMLDGLEQWVKE